MNPVGETLREARERLGLTMDEVERNTRIRAHHLAALERGDWDSMPSPVQARGFLRNYAVFLGLDADALLLQYADDIQSRRPTRPLRVSPRASPPGRQFKIRTPRWLSIDIIVATSVSLVVLVVLIWGAGRVMAALREDTLQALPAVGEPSLQTAEPEPTSVATEPAAVALPAMAEGTPTLPPGTLPAAPENVVSLRVLAEKRVWTRVLVDGEERLARRLASGEALDFQGLTSVEVVTGDGSGVRVFYQGEDQGLLGGQGEVVLRIWALEGIITPTPTVTPTDTATPRASPTPRVTPAVAPTED
jgi:cytoskeletal protein RodZ